MKYSIEGNKIFMRNHVMQGDGFAMAIKVTDGMSFGEPGKTTYEINLDNPLSGGITFQSFAQLVEFADILNNFCMTEENVLIGRDYERFINKNLNERRRERRQKRKKLAKLRRKSRK